MDFTPHTESEIAEMLRAIGVASIDELFAAIPAEARVKGELDLPGPMDEAAALAYMRGLAARNATAGTVRAFLGGGAYAHYIPAAVHHLLARGEFYTAYTPYQPELSQGTLQAQFEFQTMVASILGMDAANASMYEGATALAEAALMALRHTRRGRLLVSAAVHPQYREVLANYTSREALVEVPWDASGATDMAALAAALGPDVAGVVVQSPNFLGVVEDVAAAAALAHGAGALMLSTFSEALAFGLIEAPGVQGADIAAGEGQSLGLPLSYGGPYIGLFAVKAPLIKAMPGRLIGQTTDSRGSRCYTLTLAAREQHIRRARATSNICTNEGLCALAVAVYLSLMGREGYARLARYNHVRAENLKSILAAVPGLTFPFGGPTFNEFVVRLPGRAADAVERAAGQGVVPGLDLGRFHSGLSDCLLVAVTEQVSDEDFETLVRTLGPGACCAWLEKC